MPMKATLFAGLTAVLMAAPAVFADVTVPSPDFNLALEARAGGQLKTASYHLKRASRFKMSDAALSVVLAEYCDVLTERGKAAKAVKSCGEAVELDASNADALVARASAYKAVGKTAEAEADLRAALALAATEDTQATINERLASVND